MARETKLVTRWAPIVGQWEVSDQAIIFLSSDLPNAHGLAVSDARLSRGTVSTSIALSIGADAGRILLGYRSQNSRYVTVGLGGYGEAYVVSEFVPSAGWSRMDGAGRRSNLKDGRAYQVEVQMDGQRLRLVVDGIRVLDHVMSEPLDGDQAGLFAWGSDKVTFGPVEAQTLPPTAFVAMEFSDPFTQLFEDVIRPVAKELGVEAYRVSEVYRPGIILQDITQGIAECQVVIAEITPPNPNVFYELGYAHALGKPTILLAERGQDLPFDISGYRVIFYDNSIRGKRDVEENLRRHLTAILGN